MQKGCISFLGLIVIFCSIKLFFSALNFCFDLKNYIPYCFCWFVLHFETNHMQKTQFSMQHLKKILCWTKRKRNLRQISSIRHKMKISPKSALFARKSSTVNKNCQSPHWSILLQFLSQNIYFVLFYYMIWRHLYWAAKINIALWVLSNHDLNQNDMIFSLDDPHDKWGTGTPLCLVNMQHHIFDNYHCNSFSYNLKQLFHLSYALHYA